MMEMRPLNSFSLHFGFFVDFVFFRLYLINDDISLFAADCVSGSLAMLLRDKSLSVLKEERKN